MSQNLLSKNFPFILLWMYWFLSASLAEIKEIIPSSRNSQVARLRLFKIDLSLGNFIFKPKCKISLLTLFLSLELFEISDGLNFLDIFWEVSKKIVWFLQLIEMKPDFERMQLQKTGNLTKYISFLMEFLHLLYSIFLMIFVL